ncbi:MarR family winged helix-turn-helix transcriptional regulator [Kutzneria sp. CA-103260]|uniref:MarR family winged helix-turn-helix transcriptional regulator n=1 Tax=Kutzneria sp. CA-103260 TaxID=2802641 RepID=UPI001BA6DF75|nr:MarR family winged helix-turn-helix transcriptional regulator [Kutzneria sp. CA-103260]QUQ65708.1 transcriptional regulator [Kutzneria sp. CA-103260]
MTDLTQVFVDLVRYETRLYNVLGERLRAEHGLSLGQFEFLRIIDGRPACRVQDIADEVAITVGATSKAVDRIEAAGWVSRRPNPENRRSSLIELTTEGRRLLAAATPTFEDGLRHWLAGPLAGRSLDQLAAGLAALRRNVEQAQAGVPTG